MRSVKRLYINIVLVIAYALLIVAIMVPFTADVQFGYAQNMAMKYRWKDAESKFRQAIKIDPFNEKYLTGYGNFLLLQSRYLDHNGPILEIAEKYFVRASKLNSYNAEPYLATGLIELNRGRYDNAFTYFRNAAKNDPNGFNIAFSIGTSGVGVWKDIGKDEKVFVLNRLKLALKVRPEYADEIYTRIWKRTKGIGLLRAITLNTLEAQNRLYGFLTSRNLWQFRKEQADMVDLYRKKEDPSKLESDLRANADTLNGLKRQLRCDALPTRIISKYKWHYKNKAGAYDLLQGPLYCNATIYAPLYMEKGKTNISIQLKKLLVIIAKDPSGSKYSPYVIVKLDDKVIGEMFIANDQWQAYDFSAESDGGLKILSVSFVNDVYDPVMGEDRNLAVGDVEISYAAR